MPGVTPRKNPKRELDKFRSYVESQSEKVTVNVFLCGSALDSSKTVEEQAATDVRVHLYVNLVRDIAGCNVFFGEHTELMKQYIKAITSGGKPGTTRKNLNLALFELQLAAYVDLIVIFPSSPGSFAELGMFTVNADIGRKMLLIQKPEHKGRISFINRGPVALAQERSSKILYLDYAHKDRIYEAVHQRIMSIHQLRMSDQLFGARLNGLTS